jgi:hypothetical protein
VFARGVDRAILVDVVDQVDLFRSHLSGTTLSAQPRYAAETREILECFLEGRPIREEYLIVDGVRLAGIDQHSYSVR